ncbi:NADH-ubiquinone oxidoreductase 213 kDa subunit [Ascodesmis nigricans]|uniref:NADH-ubiquinone oxidoreductase 213 kDa subunit n=1 Tax=Ascodesmis nigricans TaxID=341454 RepID=A0A4S2MUH3_9PEZI|nr:NADH-ubiquinone oxidoreductase 213 kDa subunit [Ascodesmis nigricans]
MSDTRFQRRDAIAASTKGAMITGGIGLTLSAVQNSLAKQNVGVTGVITRTGMTIVYFTAMGGAFSFVKTAAANIREKDDFLNPTIGGLFAGAIIGTKFRSIPAVVGYSLGCGILMGVFDFCGGSLRGGYARQSVENDSYGKKMALRALQQRPVEDTLEAIGEGRGVYGPGYADRRQEWVANKLAAEQQ